MQNILTSSYSAVFPTVDTQLCRLSHLLSLQYRKADHDSKNVQTNNLQKTTFITPANILSRGISFIHTYVYMHVCTHITIYFLIFLSTLRLSTFFTEEKLPKVKILQLFPHCNKQKNIYVYFII